MAWAWHSFTIYRMPRATIARFLKDTFGDYDFYLDVGVFHSRKVQEVNFDSIQLGVDDTWKFYIPRALTVVCSGLFMHRLHGS